MATVKNIPDSKLFSFAAGIIGTVFFMFPHLLAYFLRSLPFSNIFLPPLSVILSGALFFPLFAGFCRCGMAKICGERSSFSLLFSCFGKDYIRTASIGITVWICIGFSLLCCLLPFFGCIVLYFKKSNLILLILSSLAGGVGFVVWMFRCTRYLAIPFLLFDRSLSRKKLFSRSLQLTQGAHISFFRMLFRYLTVFCLVLPVPFCLTFLTDRLAQKVHYQCRVHHIYQLEDWSV